jgi:hypothetical protein
MTIAIWVFSALLIAEFVMAPINLRTGPAIWIYRPGRR